VSNVISRTAYVTFIAIAEPSGQRVAAPRRAELLTDCEEDRTLRAVLVGMLREAGR
jgi:hypothetical protein